MKAGSHVGVSLPLFNQHTLFIINNTKTQTQHEKN